MSRQNREAFGIGRADTHCEVTIVTYPVWARIMLREFSLAGFQFYPLAGAKYMHTLFRGGVVVNEPRILSPKAQVQRDEYGRDPRAILRLISL